jgi:LL-diaminopimelate aminotransferase
MPNINDNFLKLQAGYLFPEIARRVADFTKDNPDAATKIIKLGIGDVTEPLPEACIVAMHKAVDDQSNRDTFQGYGPEQGYPWLRETIAEHDYQPRGCDITADEIFISDASKCDCANILDILGNNNTVAVTDPVYPVYVDTNVMAGNTGKANDAGQYAGLVYLPATAENNFTPELPASKADIIYLCYPNNPTGSVATKQTLSKWVNYAKEHNSLILFDAAYEAFVTDPDIPRSIYEIPGAREVAIEFRSFSKNAGFTGTRCAFTIVPKDLTGKAPDGSDIQLHSLWQRRQLTKFNGVSYIIQRGAQAAYSESGKQQIASLVSSYLQNARIIREALQHAGMKVFGGINAPYVWIKTPPGQTSWQFFDTLLNDTHIVSTPGSGFGAAGEGYLRLSAFNSRENIEQAMQRIGSALTV